MLPEYLVVAGLGAGVGGGELVSRYKDAPGRAVWTLGAAAYISLNAVASLSALALLHIFGVDFGLSGDDRAWTQVLTAGFGAMALLRSSIFIARVGDQDVPVGPAALLTQFLEAADRSVDRHRARERAKESGEIMAGIDYQVSRKALPLYCLWLLQNPDRTTADAIAQQVLKLDSEQIPDVVKSASLGLALMNLVGPGVLRTAVETLKDELKP